MDHRIGFILRRIVQLSMVTMPLSQMLSDLLRAAVQASWKSELDRLFPIRERVHRMAAHAF